MSAPEKTLVDPVEINRRVAEACGLTLSTDETWACLFKPVGEYPPQELKDPMIAEEYGLRAFDPYHDANDALWAADRVGLWSENSERMPCRNQHGWEIAERDPYGCYLNTNATADTLPAAICLSILKLAKKQD